MTHEEFLLKLTGDLEVDIQIQADLLQKENASYRQKQRDLSGPVTSFQRRIEENDYAFSILHQIRAFSAKKKKDNELFAQKDWEIVDIPAEYNNEHRSERYKLTKTDPTERHKEALEIFKKHPYGMDISAVRRLSDGVVFKAGEQVYIESDSEFSINGRINGTIQSFQITEQNTIHVITGSRYGAFYIDNIHKS